MEDRIDKLQSMVVTLSHVVATVASMNAKLAAIVLDPPKHIDEAKRKRLLADLAAIEPMIVDFQESLTRL